MKIRHIVILITCMLCLCFTACSNHELEDFQERFEKFCINVSDLDTSINQIDPDSDTAVADLLKYTDQLNEQFQFLAAMDFPEEFDFLEKLALEAGEYMEEAASSYHEAYANDSFDQAMSDYAFQNYKRAYKRVQIIIIYLHGDEPTEDDLTIK